jgi:hypothetical protein
LHLIPRVTVFTVSVFRVATPVCLYGGGGGGGRSCAINVTISVESEDFHEAYEISNFLYKVYNKKNCITIYGPR